MSIIALEKAATLKSGAVANYWKVVGAHYLEGDATARVYVAGFLDKKLHDGGADPLVVQAIELGKTQVEQIAFTRELPTKAFLYSLLSGMPLFKGATPVLSETPAKV